MVPVLLVAVLIGGRAGPAPPVQDPVCVVAHVPAGEDPGVLDLELVRRLFLVRQRFWPDGSPAYPVNLPASSPVRDRFSRAVLGRSVRDLAAYWNDRYFHGTRPPPTVASDAAMLLFVERTPGSVGYVSAGSTDALPPSVTRPFCLEEVPMDERPAGAGRRGVPIPRTRWSLLDSNQ